jgi:hypothetical protein
MKYLGFSPLYAFLTLFNGVLFAVSIVSLFSDVIFAAPEDRSFKTIIVLCSMVLLSTLLRFWQARRARRNGPASSVVLPIARRNPAQLLPAHTVYQAALHPPLWSMALRTGHAH